MSVPHDRLLAGEPDWEGAAEELWEILGRVSQERDHFETLVR